MRSEAGQRGRRFRECARRSLSPSPCCALLIRTVHEVPGLLVALRPVRCDSHGQANDIIYMGEGMMASVAVSQLSNGVLNYHNAGQGSGVERAAGHAASAHARPPHDAAAAASRSR